MRIYNSPYHQLHDTDNVVKDGQRFVIEEVPMRVEIIRRAISHFNADWLVLSAGFDIGDGDPVGGFHIMSDGFREIGRRIVRLGLPTVVVLEGGYFLERLGELAVLLGEFRSA